MHGLARLRADARKVFAAQQFVDNRAFSYVGLAGKHHLRQSVRWEITFFHRRAEKFRIVQIEHTSPPPLLYDRSRWRIRTPCDRPARRFLPFRNDQRFIRVKGRRFGSKGKQQAADHLHDDL